MAGVLHNDLLDSIEFNGTISISFISRVTADSPSIDNKFYYMIAMDNNYFIRQLYA
jgi:hypothetical protein